MEIGENAFVGCTGLMSLNCLPTGSTKIGDEAIYECTGLRSLEGLPNGTHRDW